MSPYTDNQSIYSTLVHTWI